MHVNTVEGPAFTYTGTLLTLAGILHKLHFRSEHLQQWCRLLTQQHALDSQMITEEMSRVKVQTRTGKQRRTGTDKLREMKWNITSAQRGERCRSGPRLPTYLFLLGKTSDSQSASKDTSDSIEKGVLNWWTTYSRVEKSYKPRDSLVGAWEAALTPQHQTYSGHRSGSWLQIPHWCWTKRSIDQWKWSNI